MHARSRYRLGLVGLIALALSACGGNAPDDPATADPAQLEIVEPVATRPSEPTPCMASATCETVATLSVGHGTAGVELQYDPERNDAVVRWGSMLGAVIACVESGRALDLCVNTSDAPDSCKAEFNRLADAADARAAFDAVFLTRGSPCRPQDGQP